MEAIKVKFKDGAKKELKKQLRDIRAKWKVEKKDYYIKTSFVFEGVFKVWATSEEEAKQIVSDSCGMNCGEIHATTPAVLNWDFDMKPTKKIRRCVK